MQKKSHIKLAAYLADKLEIPEIEQHRKALYFGSVLPDWNLKMAAESHTFDTTWEKVKNRIRKIEGETAAGSFREREIWTQIGVVLHYVADYFTFPHNTCFKGNLTGHCLYEARLRYLFGAYLRTTDADTAFAEQKNLADQFCSLQELFSCIEQLHTEYMKAARHSELNDCRWILTASACTGTVLTSMACRENQGMFRCNQVA